MNAPWFLLVSASLVVSWVMTLLVIRFSSRLRLIQYANQRSSHLMPTPSGGGIGIVVGAMVGGGSSVWGGDGHLLGFLYLALPLALLGLWDDVCHLQVTLRLIIQTLLILGLMTLQGLFGEADFGSIAWSLLILLLGVWWINLFNFMDGIDGLAAVQAVFMLLAGSGLVILADPNLLDSQFILFCACLIAATLGFLALNWSPAKIFMGDTGSLWLAFMIFALALYSIHNGWLSSVAWLILAAVFVVDASTTLVTRCLRGERWHEAHRSHAYQRFSRMLQQGGNEGHRMVSTMVTGINLFFLFPLAWVSLRWPQWSILCVIAAYVPLTFCAISLGAGRSDNA